MQSSPGAPPLTPICHLCGKSFGTASLPLHIPKCIEKFNQEQARLPASMRQCPPSMTLPIPASVKSKSEVEEYNAAAFETFCNSSLNRCSGCGRSFNVDALLRHLDICKGSSSASPKVQKTGSVKSDAPKHGTSQGSPSSAGPQLFTCQFCCREFGPHSLGRHLSVCVEKYGIRVDTIPVQLRPNHTVHVFDVLSELPGIEFEV